MEPVTLSILVGVAAAGAIANYLNSEESRRLASAERKRLEGMIDKLQSPRFDTSTLTPPELKLLETYVPQVAEQVYEVDPELVTLSDRARMGQGAQDAALARFQQIASGTAPGANLEVIAALDEAMQRGGAQRDAVMADMGRQGLTPSSSAYSNLQYGAANQSQKNMFMTALQAAIADRSRRDQATSQAANLGDDINRFEVDLERLNDDIVNQINRRNTQARREYLQNRANMMNEANMYNIDRRQKYSDQNMNNLFDAQLRGQGLRNKQIEADYNNDLSKLEMKSGVSNNRVNDIYAAGQDRSNMISGLANAGMTGAMMYSNSTERAADRAAYGRTPRTYTDSYDMGSEVPLSFQEQDYYEAPTPYSNIPRRNTGGPYEVPYRPGPYRGY